MKNLLCCALLLVAALVWASCSDPAKVASKTIDATTRSVMQVDLAYKKLTKEQLLRVANEERDRRTAELLKEGCVPSASQPPGAPAACQSILAASQARYDVRKAKVVAVATKLDASTGMVYAALLAAVEVLEVVEQGVKGKLPELAAVVAKAVEVGRAFLDAWSEFKKTAPSY